MKRKRNNNILVAIAIIVAVVICTNLTVDTVVKIATFRYLVEYEDEILYYEQEIPLENATAGYLDYVNEFYYYNLSNAEIELSLDELKEQGGVCSHYSKLYVDLAQKDGFNAEYVKFDTGINAHAVAIIANEGGYCVLDQTSGWCTQFRKDFINNTI